jgi:hypothetical protein
MNKRIVVNGSGKLWLFVIHSLLYCLLLFLVDQAPFIPLCLVTDIHVHPSLLENRNCVHFWANQP